MNRTAVTDESDLSTRLSLTLSSLFSNDCVYFPLRHHSPACAWHLSQLIENLRPSVILVEGPSSFTSLIPALLDPATKAPVAIYTHFIDTNRDIYKPASNELDLGPARFAAYYPFCDYSPELVALRTGSRVGARLKFIDLDYHAQVRAEQANIEQQKKPRVETLLKESHLQRSRYLQALAERSGCRDFNEMWDHLFEANFRKRATDAFIKEIATYCFFARCETTAEELDGDGTNARELAMASAVIDEKSAKASGEGPILVVTGGFHSVHLPQLVEAKIRSKPAKQLQAGSVQTALIRYSFEQLDALNGYGAGMPSPSYYDRLWQQLTREVEDPFTAVTAEILVEIGATTRKKDMQVALSTADEISALQQASLLATLRGHVGPTREDLLDGVRSCFVKGSMDSEGTVLMGVVNHVLTGRAIGEVPATAGVPPIIESFRKEAERARLDISDSLRRKLSLEIYRRDNHRRTSRFLHCLNFLNVPFANMVAGPDFYRGTGLTRLHEHWQYSWSPMTEGALVNAAIYGATIEEATINRLREAMGQLDEEGKGRSAKAAVSMLVLACRMGMHRHTGQLLRLITSRIADEPSFIEAVGAANQLMMLWQSREPLEAHSLTEIPQLLVAAYNRSCYLLPSLVQCAEEELSPALDSLASIRELLAASEAVLDEELFWQAVGGVLETPNYAHVPYSTICGAAAGLLFNANRIDESRLNELVVGHLIGLSDSQRRVGFLRGLLKTCREVAWQNTQLISALDRIISQWKEDEFIGALPSLRLALADLTPRETDKMASRVATLHGKRDLGELINFDVTRSQLEVNRRISELVWSSLANDGLTHWLDSNDE